MPRSEEQSLLDHILQLTQDAATDILASLANTHIPSSYGQFAIYDGYDSDYSHLPREQMRLKEEVMLLFRRKRVSLLPLIFAECSCSFFNL
jgi:hypothetical protein